jgi:hypothetical protein
MSGGLMQLVAYGAQDIYLTGNPQITFFKVVYRRYTNFSLEAIEQTFNGQADFGKKVMCNISRNGDLIHRTYLQATIPDVVLQRSRAPGATATDLLGFRWVSWLGHSLIKTVELEIGGQRIDKHYSAWLHIWNELTQTSGHAVGYANMVGNTADLTAISHVAGNAAADVVVKGKTLYVPLQFWFCRNHGLALPLIALQYHEVKISIEFEQVSNLYWAGTQTTSTATAWTTSPTSVTVPSLGAASIYVDYVFLDTEERRRFAQVSHEYLIEQLQFTGSESTSVGASNYKAKLSFNHPCKELIWTAQLSTTSSAPFGPQAFNFSDALYSTGADLVSGTTWDYLVAGAGGGALTAQNFFTKSGVNPVSLAKLQLNGHDRFAERPGSYFNLVQPYQHHTNVPSAGVNVYSFALLPEEHQPSGSCNMSRIDNATLQLNFTAAAAAVGVSISVYAVNYNVLRIMSGMGGLAYAN